MTGRFQLKDITVMYIILKYTKERQRFRSWSLSIVCSRNIIDDILVICVYILI